jgi:hypothetical protein
MTPITFLLTDVVQILKLVIAVSMPLAVVVAIGIWFFVKRAKRRR